MNDTQYHSASHCKYLIQYHIIWYPKFRFSVLHDNVDVSQAVAPCDVVRTLKSISAIELFKIYPQLKQFYAKCGVLWSRGYFVSTVGHISEAIVIKYIEEQKKNDRSRIQ